MQSIIINGQTGKTTACIMGVKATDAILIVSSMAEASVLRRQHNIDARTYNPLALVGLRKPHVFDHRFVEQALDENQNLRLLVSRLKSVCEQALKHASYDEHLTAELKEAGYLP